MFQLRFERPLLRFEYDMPALVTPLFRFPKQRKELYLPFPDTIQSINEGETPSVLLRRPFTPIPVWGKTGAEAPMASRETIATTRGRHASTGHAIVQVPEAKEFSDSRSQSLHVTLISMSCRRRASELDRIENTIKAHLFDIPPT